MAQGIYAPNMNMNDQRYYTAQYLNNTAYSMAQAQGNTALQAAIRGQHVPMLDLSTGIDLQWQALNAITPNPCNGGSCPSA